MASFLDKIKVNTAITHRTNQDLSCDHVTTANFMQFNVAFARELVPKQSLKVNHKTFARLQPLPVPTFGRARIQNRAFFVPFRVVFPAFNDFISDSRHSTSNGDTIIYTSVPTISSAVLTDFFTGITSSYIPKYGLAGGSTASSRADYLTKDNVKVELSQFGRYCMKLLNSLGYSVIFEHFDPEIRVSSQFIKYSALPLLCVAKVYADWYYPSMYTSNPLYAQVEEIFNRDNGNTDLSLDDVYLIFDFLRKVNYDSDYFTSAWENPVSPNSDAQSQISMPDITTSIYNSDGSTNQRNVVSNTFDSKSTPTIMNQDVDAPAPLAGFHNIGHLSQYAVTALKSLTDYLKRHQLVGGRTLDRYLARFGVKLSDEILKRSQYVGTSESNIQFGDVMSTADTGAEGAALGDYAGKGIGYGDGTYTYENEKEYGMFIVISSIVPKTGYYQGIDRNVMHTTRFDYWTPEFDRLGVQAVSCAELYIPSGNKDNEFNIIRGGSLDYWQKVFGFVPRYAEYKLPQDRLSGDFRFYSINEGMDSWHTMRQINPLSVSDIVISEDFISGDDSSQYNRIFNNTDDTYDKFIVIHTFDISTSVPFANYWDNYDFEQKGNEVIMQANGVKMN